jgi:hypothetical protein
MQKRAYPRPAVANSILSLARLRCDSRQSLRLSSFRGDLERDANPQQRRRFIQEFRTHLVQFYAVSLSN